MKLEPTITIAEVEPIKLVIWFVDDNVNQEEVRKPMLRCVREFAKYLAGNREPEIKEEFPPRLTANTPASLAVALRWLTTFKLPTGIRLSGNYSRDIEILVYGISRWAPLKKYLGIDVEGGPGGRAFWPHLVVTDVFDGVLETINNPEEVKSKAGYEFAKSYCLPKQLPLIVISSEKSVIDRCGPDWQGDKNLYYFHRHQFNGGDVLRTLEKLAPQLLRRWWIPEFALAVEGRKEIGASMYDVTFTKDSKIVSIKNVSPVPYAFLYLCAHGSVLAKLKNWDKELLGWEKSNCIAVSLPPTVKASNNGAPVQLLPTIMQLFQEQYWQRNKDEIFYGGNSRNRTHNVLNANIIHLDVPFDRSFPSFWDNDAAKGNLITSMREILPPDGMKWLAGCCA